jgi:hypothetical protein
MKRKVTVLSIDGGGIRGVIPAVILNCIEEGLQRRAGDDAVFLSSFDMAPCRVEDKSESPDLLEDVQSWSFAFNTTKAGAFAEQWCTDSFKKVRAFAEQRTEHLDGSPKCLADCPGIRNPCQCVWQTVRASEILAKVFGRLSGHQKSLPMCLADFSGIRTACQSVRQTVRAPGQLQKSQDLHVYGKNEKMNLLNNNEA